MVDEGRVEGFASDIGSKQPDAVGDIAGDAATRADREASQAAGQAHDQYEWIVDEILQLTEDRSSGALLAAMAMGMAIGFPYFAPLNLDSRARLSQGSERPARIRPQSQGEQQC